MDELIYNPYTISIIGGIVSAVIAGLILGFLPSKRHVSFHNLSHINARGCMVTVAYLALLGMVNTFVLAATILVILPGVPDVERGFFIIFAVLCFVFMNATLIASWFFGIDILSIFRD